MKLHPIGTPLTSLALAGLLLLAACDRSPTAAAPRSPAEVRAAATPATAWHNLSQQQRNQAIIARAQKDLNKYVGQVCKEWVRTVVLSASGGVVNLPATVPNASGPKLGSSKYLVELPSIRSAEAGSVVQMQWRLNSKAVTPHTFIVTNVTSTGITVIESNWAKSLGVTTRTISFTEFNAHVIAYGVYRVVG